MMLIPVIKIREEMIPGEPHEHLVGTNHHDCLYVENGGIFYVNTQGVVGTQYPEESHMEFVAEPCDENGETFTGNPEIRFVPVEEYLNILQKALKEEADNEEEFQRLIPEILETARAKLEHDKRLNDLKKSDGYVWHT